MFLFNVQSQRDWLIQRTELKIYHYNGTLNVMFFFNLQLFYAMVPVGVFINTAMIKLPTKITTTLWLKWRDDICAKRTHNLAAE